MNSLKQTASGIFATAALLAAASTGCATTQTQTPVIDIVPPSPSLDNGTPAPIVHRPANKGPVVRVELKGCLKEDGTGKWPVPFSPSVGSAFGEVYRSGASVTTTIAGGACKDPISGRFDEERSRMTVTSYHADGTHTTSSVKGIMVFTCDEPNKVPTLVDAEALIEADALDNGPVRVTRFKSQNDFITEVKCTKPNAMLNAQNKQWFNGKG